MPDSKVVINRDKRPILASDIDILLFSIAGQRNA